MTVREYLETVHDRLLKTFTRGKTVEGGDETDHWSRDVTEVDAAAINERTASITAELLKKE